MSDFKTKMMLDVEFEYPKLNQPYVFNSNTRRSEPCDPSRPGAAKSVSFKVDKERATELWNEAKAHFNNCKSRKPDMGDYKGIHSYRQNEDDTISFRAQRKSMTSRGTPSQEVRVVDGQRKPLENLAIWGGSKGNLIFAMWPSFNQSKNEWGVSLMLEAVQVTHAVYGADEVDDFPTTDTANISGAGDFPVSNGGAGKVDNIIDDFDDEIPF